jgi:hypothetical protein
MAFFEVQPGSRNELMGGVAVIVSDIHTHVVQHWNMNNRLALVTFHASGSVTPQPPTGGPGKTLNELEKFTVIQSIIHKPTLHLQEVQKHLYSATGKWVSPSTCTICRTIKVREFT